MCSKRGLITMSGILSKNAKIGYSASGTASYTNIPDVQSISEIGSDMETVEVTTLADSSHKYIKGLDDYGSLEVKMLYSKTNYQTLKGLTGTINFQIELPETLKISFAGQTAIKIDEISVGEAMTMTLSIAINSDMTIA